MRGNRRQVKLRDRVPEHRLEVLRAQLDRQLREARPNFEWSVWINHGPTHHAYVQVYARRDGRVWHAPFSISVLEHDLPMMLRMVIHSADVRLTR